MQSELKQITNLALFAKVVQIGGISRCAISLGMERTTVSRRIADLEKSLGVRLLTRTPRSIAVTEAGRECFDKCEEILVLAKSAEAAATNRRHAVNVDPIVIGSSLDLLERFVAPSVSEFERENPNAAILCVPVFRGFDTLQPGTDLLVSWEKLNTSEYSVSRLGALPQAVYASLDFISKHGVPQTPDDLHNYRRIGVGGVGPGVTWSFAQGGKRRQITSRPDVEVFNMQEAISSALAGIGICMAPTFLGDRYVEAGRLVHILSNYELPARQLYLVGPRSGASKPRQSTFRLILEKNVSATVTGSFAEARLHDATPENRTRS